MRYLTFIALIGLFWVSLSSSVYAQECQMKRPIIFAGFNWESNSFHTAVSRYIIEKGYGCKTDEIPGATTLLYGGMIRGNIDIAMEIWGDNFSKLWADALRKGKIIPVGTNFPDAIQAWYVPKYMVEGENAPAKGLKSVFDLPKFKLLFKDPEHPSKGRFYNCVIGWVCEAANSKKLKGYGLDKHFTNFHPGAGSAMISVVTSHIKRKRPIFFFYWGPTSLLGRLQDQLVRLEEPPYDEKIWKEMMSQKNPVQATAFSMISVPIGISKKFAEEAPPSLIKFLQSYETRYSQIQEQLVYMDETNSMGEKTARHFLNTKKEIWKKWVPENIAERIEASLEKK